MHKHDPKPPKRHTSLDEQDEDDPLDSTTMPHATRPGPPDKNKRHSASRVPKIHGASHQPIEGDRTSAEPGHGRSHLPSHFKKGGGGGKGNYTGPEKVGEREARDEGLE